MEQLLAKLTKFNIIDVHGHLYVKESLSAYKNELYLKYARKFNFNKVCVSVLGTSGLRSPEDMASKDDFIYGNRELLKFMKKYPDFVLGYCYVNPQYKKESLEEFKRCIEDFGMIGLKLLASCRCDDDLVFPLIEKVIDYDVVILQHVYHRKPKNELWLSDSKNVAELARLYPEAKIIMAHTAGGGDWEWGIKAVRDCPNVFIDTSGSGADIGMIETAVKEVGAKRVVFGTDLNLCAGVGKILGAEITEGERKLIFEENIKILLPK